MKCELCVEHKGRQPNKAIGHSEKAHAWVCWMCWTQFHIANETPPEGIKGDLSMQLEATYD